MVRDASGHLQVATEGEAVVHDPTDLELAFALSRLSGSELDHTPIGIFRQVSAPTYDAGCAHRSTAAPAMPTCSSPAHRPRSLGCELKSDRAGLLYGIGAYTLWGLFPLYWPLLAPASSWEILAHRMLEFRLPADHHCRHALMGPGPHGLGRSPGPTAATGRRGAGVVNWGRTSGRSTTATWWRPPWGTSSTRSSRCPGVVVLRGDLRRTQWFAVGIAGLAVLVLTASYGRPPWIALILAFRSVCTAWHVNRPGCRRCLR